MTPTPHTRNFSEILGKFFSAGRRLIFAWKLTASFMPRLRPATIRKRNRPLNAWINLATLYPPLNLPYYTPLNNSQNIIETFPINNDPLKYMATPFF